MADDQTAGGTVTQTNARPQPPMAPLATLALGLYQVVLALAIGYFVIVLWPPSPKSVPLSPAERAANSKALADRAAQDLAQADKDLADKVAAVKTAGTGSGATKAAADLAAAQKLDTDRSAAFTLLAKQAAENQATVDKLIAEGRPVGPSVPIHLLGRTAPWQASPDLEVVLFVMAVGAMGAFVHAATSYATFVGNGSITQGWGWWYVLRPLIGAALATVFYVVLRGGLGGATVDATNAYGAAAIAGLVGMCSKQATDKLEDIFKSAFRTPDGKGDDLRAGKVGGTPKPVVTAVKPNPIQAGSKGVTLTVTGTGFSASSTVRVEDVELKPSSCSQTELQVSPSDTVLASSGSKKVVVVNPPDSGGPSDPLILTVS